MVQIVFRLYFVLMISTLFAVFRCKPISDISLHEMVCTEAGCEEHLPEIICSKRVETSHTNPYLLGVSYQCILPGTNEIIKETNSTKPTNFPFPFEFTEYQREKWQGGQFS